MDDRSLTQNSVQFQVTFELSYQNQVIASDHCTYNVAADSNQRLEVAHYTPTQLGEYEFTVTLRDNHTNFLADNSFLFQITPSANGNSPIDDTGGK